MFIAAYRGQLEVVAGRAEQIRDDAEARGEGYALSAANFAEAILFIGPGRYRRRWLRPARELPYTHELSYAMRTLLELVEAAARTGDRPWPRRRSSRLASVTGPLGDTTGPSGCLRMAEAQLHEGDHAAACYREAIERFERDPDPDAGPHPAAVRRGASPSQPRVDARDAASSRARATQFAACTASPSGRRRELRATGETVRARGSATTEQLTGQELNVARLARDGLTNRDIGARLFISARTAEYHLRKVFVKLGINARSELRTALADVD